MVEICSWKAEKESYMIGISFIGTKVWGLAEVLSISFLRLSTHTSVKKTEMNQNVTFPDVNAMNKSGQGNDISPQRSQMLLQFPCKYRNGA